MKLADLKPCKPGDAWVMQVPVISTRHLPQAERDWMETLTEDDGGVVFQKQDKQWPGTLFVIEEDIIDDGATVGQTLNALCRLLAQRGFAYARFDPDGEIFSDLPTYP